MTSCARRFGAIRFNCPDTARPFFGQPAYSYAWRINGSYGTGGVPDAITINPEDQYQLFQANLNFKF
jgi:hypothetical protein